MKNAQLKFVIKSMIQYNEHDLRKYKPKTGTYKYISGMNHGMKLILADLED